MHNDYNQRIISHKMPVYSHIYIPIESQDEDASSFPRSRSRSRLGFESPPLSPITSNNYFACCSCIFVTASLVLVAPAMGALGGALTGFVVGAISNGDVITYAWRGAAVGTFITTIWELPNIIKQIKELHQQYYELNS